MNNVVELKSKELNEFSHGLNDLPELELSELELKNSWQNIQSEVNAPKTKRYFAWLGVAASALLVSVMFFNNSNDFVNTPENLSTKSVTENVAPESFNKVSNLKRYNAELDARVLQLPEPVVLRANTMDTITRLEDKVEMLDYRLALSEQQPLTLQEQQWLYQERARAMQGIYRVRAAQAQRVNQYQAASFQRVAYN